MIRKVLGILVFDFLIAEAHDGKKFSGLLVFNKNNFFRTFCGEFWKWERIWFTETLKDSLVVLFFVMKEPKESDTGTCPATTTHDE